MGTNQFALLASVSESTASILFMRTDGSMCFVPATYSTYADYNCSQATESSIH